MCCFLVIIYSFTAFLRVIKGIEYNQIIITLYPPNSMIFPCSNYVKFNVFDHSGTLVKDTQNKPYNRKILQ